uniref:NADH-ubiquinone oxidoreductase chain 3 n=1 Tax=Xiphinema pachtaicum TaxID=260251 RepID=A0A1P8C794_9BILA|nr:NADH dehydrogenase subunit 3 [Xiphinema pachtaicum]AOT84271.1 NADH dehydrogenase subunit 3 [Xiphinema pachtaicum]
MILLLSTFLLVITSIFVVLQFFLTENEVLNSKSLTSLESGFEKICSPASYSCYFVFMAVLFVLFDVELVLLVPLVMSSVYSLKGSFWIMVLIIFFVYYFIIWVVLIWLKVKY